MRQRVDVDEKQPPVVIPAAILNELYRHALDTQPEECCGLIVGDDTARYQQVERCRNEMTALHQKDPSAYPRDGREAFYMSEADYLRAQTKAEGHGMEVTAVYHSHVGSDVYLSEMDLEYAESGLFPFPEADQLVISVVAGKVAGLGVFRRDRPAGAFTGRTVEPRVS